MNAAIAHSNTFLHRYCVRWKFVEAMHWMQCDCPKWNLSVNETYNLRNWLLSWLNHMKLSVGSQKVSRSSQICDIVRQFLRWLNMLPPFSEIHEETSYKRLFVITEKDICYSTCLLACQSTSMCVFPLQWWYLSFRRFWIIMSDRITMR